MAGVLKRSEGLTWIPRDLCTSMLLHFNGDILSRQSPELLLLSPMVTKIMSNAIQL